VREQGNRGKPFLMIIPFKGPFDIIGMDFIELDISKSVKITKVNGPKSMPYPTGKQRL